MKSEEVVAALAALAQETRLAIFRSLVKRGPQGYTPGDLMERIEIPAPTLSFHLKGLQRAGLLASRREGRFLYYSADFEKMQALIGFLTEKCCALANAGCDTECKPTVAVKRKRA
jgi:DNA-binding transcriptional ArsR family regulator